MGVVAGRLVATLIATTTAGSGGGRGKVVEGRRSSSRLGWGPRGQWRRILEVQLLLLLLLLLLLDCCIGSKWRWRGKLCVFDFLSLLLFDFLLLDLPPVLLCQHPLERSDVFDSVPQGVHLAHLLLMCARGDVLSEELETVVHLLAWDMYAST